MNLKDRIEAEFTQAIKSGDRARRSVLAMLKSAIYNKAIEKGKKNAPVSDEDAQDVILSEIKKRKDALAHYKTAGRDDLAKKEEEEAAMLMTFLPVQLSQDEVLALVSDAIAKTGASTKKDTGKVLAALSKQAKGRADMSMVAHMVKEKLLG